MKRTISLLLMSFMGMVGTYAWAGSNREDTVDRLQKSVDVLHAIMTTHDKGIPEEGKMHFGRARLDQRWLHHWRQARTWCCNVPYHRWLECTSIRLGWRRQLGITDWRRRCGPGHAGHERPRFSASAVQQIRTHR